MEASKGCRPPGGGPVGGLGGGGLPPIGPAIMPPVCSLDWSHVSCDGLSAFEPCNAPG